MTDEIKELNDIIQGMESSKPKTKTPDIKVVGVGGGGNNAINYMYNKGIKGVAYVNCNTDRQALEHSPVPVKVQLGDGLGAGNKPEVGKAKAEEALDDINKIFDDDTKMVFITAGMGGGTGTGAGPVIARAAKERGLLTIGIVTIPFLFEGEKKIKKALAGADEMSKNVDALLVINNERLVDMYPDLNFCNGFAKADDTLATAAQSISDIITYKGYVNVDFNDVDTTLRNGGTAVISSGYGEGENRVTKAIHNTLNSPLLKNRDILRSKRLLFCIYFDPNAENAFKMDEISELTNFITQIDSEVDVKWGAVFDDTLGDKVKMTILAAGFDVTINDEVKVTGRPATFPPTTSNADDSSAQRADDEYGGKLTEIQTKRETNRHVIMTPDQWDDDAIIEAFEQTPTIATNHKQAVDQVKNAKVNEPAQPSTPANGNPNASANGRTISFTNG